MGKKEEEKPQSEPIPFRCLKDLVDAIENGKEVDEALYRSVEWEEELIRQAIETPHALLTTKTPPPYFEVKDYRIAWKVMRELLPSIKPGERISEGHLLGALAREEPIYFGSQFGRFWLDPIMSGEPCGIPYAIGELLPTLHARFEMKHWKKRTEEFISRVDTTKDPQTLQTEWRLEAYAMSLTHDGGLVGKLISDAIGELDMSDKTNRNIVRLGIPEIDRFNGGGHGRGEMMVIGGGTSHGKCLRKGTTVLMFNGSVRLVEEIRQGDLLLGPDGAPRRVLRTNRGRAEMFEVRPIRGTSWYCNEDHILTLCGTGERASTCAKRRSGREGTRWGGQVIDVSVREWMTWSKKRKHNFKLMHANAIEFGGYKQPFPIDPYFLGVLLGDGSMQHGTPHVSTPDQEIIAEVHRQAKKFKLHVRVTGTNPKCRNYSLAGHGAGKPNPLMALLAKMGLRGTTCHDKFIPFDYKVASKSDRLQLLAGLIDTDGSVAGGPDRSGYEFVSKSKQLADDVAFVARSLGMVVRRVQRVRKGCQTGAVGTYYRLRIGGREATSIPVRTPRRQLSAASYRRNMLLSGFKVIPTGKLDEYYGFTLDGDGRFLLDDFTVTHNSYMAQRLMRLQAGMKQRALYISVEDSDELVVARFVADLSLSIGDKDRGVIAPHTIRDRTANEAMVDEVKQMARDELGDYLYFFDAKKWTCSRICDLIRRHRYLCGIDLVIIDYLQAIQPDESSNNRTADTGAIVAKLKSCCHEAGVALVLLSQYARDEYRNGAIPTITSCKYAGEIENESEIMLLLWRDDDNRLHAKVAKLKWSKAAGRKYIISTSEHTGCFMGWEDDFSENEDQSKQKRGPQRRSYGQQGGTI